MPRPTQHTSVGNCLRIWWAARRSASSDGTYSQLEHSCNLGGEGGVVNVGDIPGAFIRRRPTIGSKLPSGRRRRKVIGSESRIQSEKCLGSLPYGTIARLDKPARKHQILNICQRVERYQTETSIRCRSRWLRAPATRKPRLSNRIEGFLFTVFRVPCVNRKRWSGRPSRRHRDVPCWQWC